MRNEFSLINESCDSTGNKIIFFRDSTSTGNKKIFFESYVILVQKLPVELLTLVVLDLILHLSRPRIKINIIHVDFIPRYVEFYTTTLILCQNT